MCQHFQILAFLAIVFLLSPAAEVHGLKSVLYEDSEFRGSSITVDIWGCYNVPADWNDRASSINTLGNCIRAFEHGECRGSWTDIAPGTPSHNNLVNIGFNDRISSLGLCNSNIGGGSTNTNPDPVPVPSVPGGDWRQAALNSHNQYRAKHGVQPLQLSDEINRSAQKCAEYLAANRIFAHVCKNVFGHPYGENLYMKISSFEEDAKVVALESVKGWYDEEPLHNYNSNTFQHPSGHFSQLVWKSSERMGIGFARNGDRKVIVAHYDPHGNIIDHFLENVFRPRS